MNKTKSRKSVRLKHGTHNDKRFTMTIRIFDEYRNPVPITFIIYYFCINVRPVTLLSTLVFQEEGGVLQTVLQGEGGGEVLQKFGKGKGFHFLKINRDFFNSSKFCPFDPPLNGPPEAAPRLRRLPVGRGPAAGKNFPNFRF